MYLDLMKNLSKRTVIYKDLSVFTYNEYKFDSYKFYLLFIIVFFTVFFFSLTYSSNILINYEEKRTLRYIQKNNSKFNSFIKESNINWEDLSKKDSYIIIKFLKQNDILKSYYKIIGTKNFSDTLEALEIEYYLSESELSYANAGFLEEYNKIMEDGIIFKYEKEHIDSLYEDRPIKEGLLLESITSSLHITKLKALYDQDMKNQGFIKRSSFSDYSDIMVEYYDSVIKYTEVNSYNVLDLFIEKNIEKVEDLSFYFQNLEDKSKIEKLFNEFKESDGFLNNLEAEILDDLIDDQRLKEYKSSPSYEIVQKAAQFAIENNYKGKEKILEEINKNGKIHRGFNDTLNDIFKDNHPLYKDQKLFLYENLEYIFKPVSNYDKELLERYYLSECSQARLYLSDLNVDILTEAIVDKTKLVYLKYCYND